MVTEYFRTALHVEQNTEPIDGILYPGARNSGRPGVVLFANRTDVVGIKSDDHVSQDSPWPERIGVEHFEVMRSLDCKRIEVPSFRSLDRWICFGMTGVVLRTVFLRGTGAEGRDFRVSMSWTRLPLMCEGWRSA